MPGTHALLSASSAERWLNCPPSARLTADMPDSGSEYASEGTLAHELCELKLRKKFETLKKSEYDKRLAVIKANPLYQPEMDGYTDVYLDHILTIAHGYKGARPYVVIEKKLDYSDIAEGGFGTGDCVLMCGNDLHIIDFKYGRGVAVSAEDNPQLKLYALGAAKEYGFLYDITNVTLHIVQPRLADGISSWSLPFSELTAWGNSIKPKAEQANTGGGDFRCGDWCRFCKAKASCKARAEYFLTLEDTKGTPADLLTDAELGDVLVRALQLKNWVSDIEEYALAEILAGRDVEGWKAVEGRSNRKITDIDTAFKTLTESGYDEALLYERKPLTLTALEKLVTPSKLTELIGAQIAKPKGAPTLAPATDKRKPYEAVNVNEIFGGTNNE
jgi:hypothetical protein